MTSNRDPPQVGTASAHEHPIPRDCASVEKGRRRCWIAGARSPLWKRRATGFPRQINLRVSHRRNGFREADARDASPPSARLPNEAIATGVRGQARSDARCRRKCLAIVYHVRWRNHRSERRQRRLLRTLLDADDDIAVLIRAGHHGGRNQQTGVQLSCAEDRACGDNENAGPVMGMPGDYFPRQKGSNEAIRIVRCNRLAEWRSAVTVPAGRF